MKFCSLVLELHLPQNFCHTHTQTDRQAFSRNSQIVFRTPKAYISIKNRKSTIFTKSILSSMHIEDSKKLDYEQRTKRIIRYGQYEKERHLNIRLTH